MKTIYRAIPKTLNAFFSKPRFQKLYGFLYNFTQMILNVFSIVRPSIVHFPSFEKLVLTYCSTYTNENV